MTEHNNPDDYVDIYVDLFEDNALVGKMEETTAENNKRIKHYDELIRAGKYMTAASYMFGLIDEEGNETGVQFDFDNPHNNRTILDD